MIFNLRCSYLPPFSCGNRGSLIHCRKGVCSVDLPKSECSVVRCASFHHLPRQVNGRRILCPRWGEGAGQLNVLVSYNIQNDGNVYRMQVSAYRMMETCIECKCLLVRLETKVHHRAVVPCLGCIQTSVYLLILKR